jgi:hypothetical protein
VRLVRRLYERDIMKTESSCQSLNVDMLFWLILMEYSIGNLLLRDGVKLVMLLYDRSKYLRSGKELSVKLVI